jgi:hypothetical protein
MLLEDPDVVRVAVGPEGSQFTGYRDSRDAGASNADPHRVIFIS